MPAAKKAKKDAKEAGGVVAAVTKHASGKFISNANTAGNVSDTSNISDPSTNGQPSPMLEPTSVLAIPQSIPPAPRAIPGMADWAARGGISASLGTSPGNLINLNGESPPSRWSSPRPYGTSHTSHTSHTSTSHTSHTSHLSRASYGSHNTSTSVSPPSMGGFNGMARQRPVSFHMDSASPYSTLSGSPHALSGHLAASPSNRRDSMHSRHSLYAQSRGMASTTATVMPANPPLPHQAQPHFYGAPEIEIDSQQRQAGMKPGQRGYHFSFDTLPSSYRPSGSSETVVTTGYEGGLEVYSVSKNGLGLLASLTGLRGGVYHAKILPWTAASSSVAADAFPLVAVVVHGPVLPTAPAHNPDDAGGPETGPESYAGGPHEAAPNDTGPQASPKIDQRSDFGGNGKPAVVGGTYAPPIEYYQTTVEVYSLKLNRHVCTLLEAPEIQLQTSVTSPIFQPPPPSGAFRIKADAGNIVISSAVSGECWLYRQMAFPGTSDLPFAFVAKVWTTLQQSPKGASQNGEPVADSDRTRSTSSTSSSAPRLGLKQPILSLSGKYLAYCPAAPSSSIALRASVPVVACGRTPGFSSSTPPHPPPVTAELDVPDAESMVNKIMRDATQELISGAKWIGQQGMQAFSSYWKGSAGSSTPQTPRSPPSSVGYTSPSGRLDAGQFPPTHGSAAPAMAPKEPGLVSIVDITTVGNSSVVHPIATYAPPLGCSFLSFSPTGLWLFTASSKGDVQTVWDLLRIQYTKSSPLQAYSMPGTPAGHRVRQVAQFSRMTVACIVDVAWAKPNGERLAMVTERGTVHLLDLPSSSYMWPPPRRRGARVAEAGAAGSSTGGAYDKTVNGGAGVPGRAASNAVSYASSAFSTAFDAARPLLVRPRRSSANVPQSTGAILADHASHGGKMLAAGISHSLGKTSHAINQLRHTGENRVSLPHGPLAPGPSCAVWVAGKRHHSLYVIGDGLVRRFSSRTREKSSGRRVLYLGLSQDSRVPNIPDDVLAPAIKHFLDPAEYADMDERNDAASNTMVLDSSAQRKSADHKSNLSAVESAIPQAEIESSAPYQPFHTDRRVALYEYGPQQQQQHEQYGVADEAPAFTPEVDSRPITAKYEPPTSEFSAMTLVSPPPEIPEVFVADEDVPLTLPKKKKKKKSHRIVEEVVEEVVTPSLEPMDEPDAYFTDAPIPAPIPTPPATIAPTPKHAVAESKPKVQPPKTSWAFGQPIVATLVDTGFPPMSEEESFNICFEDTRALPASAIERVFQQGEDEHIVVTTRRRRGGNRGGGGDDDDDDDDDGFFEDDCEVLDFADQRV